MDENNVLVLFSGGLDSTTCIAHYLNQKLSVKALFIDYGQLAATQEYIAASIISKYYGISLNTIKCSGFNKFGGGVILGRNAFLLFTALMKSEFKNGIIAIGIHSGTAYVDCSASFVKYSQSLFDLYTDGKYIIGTPFVDWNKHDIFKYANHLKIPLEMTYSCELGNKQPCGHCLSCKDLEVLYASKE